MISHTYENKYLLHFGIKIYNIYYFMINANARLNTKDYKQVYNSLHVIQLLEFILYQYYTYSVLYHYHLQGRSLTNSSSEGIFPYFSEMDHISMSGGFPL
jgi:hypothetical protein